MPNQQFSLSRYNGNPILKPNPQNSWEAKAVFNAGCIYEGGKFHIIYRAMSHKNVSVLGYASSKDGFHIDERLPKPIYTPREIFEKNLGDKDSNSGCEDPRLVRIGNKIHMFYTSYDGKNPPSGTISSISVKDFLAKKWNWSKPRLLTLLKEDNKDICIFPEKIGEKFIIIHRTEMTADYKYIDSLYFPKKDLKIGNDWFGPREGFWDDWKVGVNGPPIKTEYGWLMLYHGVQKNLVYRLGAILLDLNKPENIIYRTKDPIFEPIEKYEKIGEVNNVVFSCGAVIVGETLYVYYGGADTVIGVATCKLKDLIAEIKK